MFWGIKLSSFGLCGKRFYPPSGLPSHQLFIFTGSNNSFFFLFRDYKLCVSIVSDKFDLKIERQVKGSALGRRLAFDVGYMSRDTF